MLRQLIAVTVCALCVGAQVTASQAPATPAPSTPDTYRWHAELVSLDATARTLTVKASALTEAADEVQKLAPGTRITLQWSGAGERADAIRRISKAGAAASEMFLLPVELASREVQNGYVTFRIRVPEVSIPAVKALEPGEWVTVTARQRPAGEAEAIVSVNPYVQSAPRGTN